MTLRNRLLSSVTAATFVLAPISAVGQTVDDQIVNDLQGYGYDVSTVELSTEEVAELRNVLNSDRNRAAKERHIQEMLAEKDWPGFAFANLDVRSDDAQVVENRLMAYGIEVEGENLSPAEISEVRAVFGGEEPWAQKKRQLQQALSNTAYTNYEGVGMLREQLDAQLEELGIEMDVDSLSDKQAVEVQAILTGADSDAEARRLVQEVAGMG